MIPRSCPHWSGITLPISLVLQPTPIVWPSRTKNGSLRQNLSPHVSHHTLCMTSFSKLSSTSSWAPSNIIGGDYAGLSATFSSISGELIPVPDHLVPQAMLEWGDIPSCLETLSSEKLDDEEFERYIITALPEVGCGIDNLETMKKIDRYNAHCTHWRVYPHQNNLGQDLTFTHMVSPQKYDWETIFQVGPESSSEDNGVLKEVQRRIRVSVSLDFSTISKLSANILLHVERQSSSQSSRGTAWTAESYNSGGLDARTVLNYIGNDIAHGDVFAVNKLKQNQEKWDVLSKVSNEKTNFHGLTGKWMQTMKCPKNNLEKHWEIERDVSDFHRNDSNKHEITTLQLPQNLLLRYGYRLTHPDLDNSDSKNCINSTKCWGIELSHFHSTSETVDKNDYCSEILSRRTVLHLFQEGRECTNLEGIYCWDEKKC